MYGTYRESKRDKERKRERRIKRERKFMLPVVDTLALEDVHWNDWHVVEVLPSISITVRGEGGGGRGEGRGEITLFMTDREHLNNAITKYTRTTKSLSQNNTTAAAA